MSTKKKLNKELILVSGLTGLPLPDYVKRVDVLADVAIANPLIAPDLDPTPIAIKAKSAGITKAVGERTLMESAVLSKTVYINKEKSELTNFINNSWAPDAQKACAGDAEKAKLLAWYSKGIDTGEADAKAIVGSVTDSYPSIQKIDSSNHLMHTAHIRNSASGKRGLPLDAKSTELYMQIGGLTPPVDYKTMQHVGAVINGSRIINFDAADIGKPVYYIALYIGKKSKIAMIQSPVMSAVVS